MVFEITTTLGPVPSSEPILEQPALTPMRKMRVVCIGAGFAGLTLAHKVQHELKLEEEIDLAIYEKNTDIGGVWFENIYPGAACDLPAHTYVFPFESNPDWSHFYAKQDEILSYMKRTATKWDLYKNVNLGSKVFETIWDEPSARWKIKIDHNGSVKEDEADVLINASGPLNKWKWPDVGGINKYRGKLVHSAKWDPSYEWKGKKVAVIGNGASGIQIVTKMQPHVSSLVNYMRSPTWVSVNVLCNETPEGVNFAYSEAQKQHWRENSAEFSIYRKHLESSLNSFFFAFSPSHPANNALDEMCKAHLHSSLKDAPELEKRMRPSFKPGCRRLTPGEGYLEALQQPNCRDCWDPIECFTEKGIKTTAGDEDFDMIVCATGFDGSWHPQWKLVGRDGATLEDLWSENPTSFLSVHAEKLPNYFMMGGPSTPLTQGSIMQQYSCVSDYILRWVTKMNRQDICTMEVKSEAVSSFNDYNQRLLQRTVWSHSCRSFYKNGKSEGFVGGLWGGSLTHFQNTLEQVGSEHFELTWRSKNRFRWLGNGSIESDKNGAGDLAPYIQLYS